MRRIISCFLLSLLYATTPASAQSRPFFEFEAGAGYVFGRGAENPGPSLGTYDIGVVGWPLRSWGVAYRIVRGPGEDLLDPPLEGHDRLFLGSGDLRYMTFTVRYRRGVARRVLTELGVGVMTGGRFSALRLIREREQRIETHTAFNGFAFEALIGRHLAPPFSVKGGLTCDFNFETGNLQPVVLASLGF